MPQKQFDWKKLPQSVACRLAGASVGKGHLLGIGQKCYDAAARAREDEWLFGLGFDVQYHGWASSPFEAAHANHLLALNSRLARLETDAAYYLSYAAANIAVPQNEKYLNRLLRLGEWEKLRLMIRRGLEATPQNLFWWSLVWTVAEKTADWQWLLETPDPGGDEAGVSLRRVVFADAAFLSGDYERALSLYNEIPWAGLELRQGECLLRLGRGDEAVDLWRKSLAVRPWDVTLLMRLHDEVTGAGKRVAAPPGRVAVLLYTWNKAESLERTLASLAETDLCGARVVILNNGCTDGTASVISAAVGRLGPENVTVLRAPVNVGAPAARNWLLALPELSDCGFLVYLDDDVLLSRDWLRQLGAACDAYPKASVWGCRVVSADMPHQVQHADMHLLPPPGTPQLDLTAGTASFGLTRSFEEQADFGQFSYLRPCTSVTGCCHMFRRETLLAAGGFDLQFSPSQFDDLDLDIRLARNGGYAVYQGHLAVRHDKVAGAAALSNGDDLSYGVAGNIYKLYRKHTAGEMERVLAYEQEIVIADILRKMQALEI